MWGALKKFDHCLQGFTSNEVAQCFYRATRMRCKPQQTVEFFVRTILVFKENFTLDASF